MFNIESLLLNLISFNDLQSWQNLRKFLTIINCLNNQIRVKYLKLFIQQEDKNINIPTPKSWIRLEIFVYKFHSHLQYLPIFASILLLQFLYQFCEEIHLFHHNMLQAMIQYFLLYKQILLLRKYISCLQHKFKLQYKISTIRLFLVNSFQHILLLH